MWKVYTKVVLLLFLSACSIQNYRVSDSKIITIKTEKLKFSDLGYLKSEDDAVRLELFIAGKLLQTIEINHLICVDGGCMSKRMFHTNYLSAHYPDTLLQNITLGHAIYDAKNLLHTADGFEQNIKNKDVDISYRVQAHQIYFKDRKNKILFIIKDLK